MKFIKKTMCAVLIFGSCCKSAFSESCEGLCKSQKTQVMHFADSVDVEKKKSVYQKEGIGEGLICAICGAIMCICKDEYNRYRDKKEEEERREMERQTREEERERDRRDADRRHRETLDAIKDKDLNKDSKDSWGVSCQ